MNKRIVYIAKTDLNTDGRILNQLEILSQTYRASTIDFILFPDKKTKIKLPNNVHLHEIKGSFRGNPFLRLFTVFEWTVKALRLLLKIKPEILHAQDTATTFPVLIYRAIKRKSFFLIYDDHELPNENEPIVKKIFDRFENILIRKSDKTVFANEERLKYLKEKLSLDESKLTFFLNLPYFAESEYIVDTSHAVILSDIDKSVADGVRFIIHQGPLKKERGRDLLADFSQRLPPKIKMLLLGGNEADFKKFIAEYGLNEEKFYFVGSVPYSVLPLFWTRGAASIVMYLPDYLNNKLCAPNRLYISVENRLPVIVNRNNPVLSNFIHRYKAGFFIDEFDHGQFEWLFKYEVEGMKDRFDELKKRQIEQFITCYEDFKLASSITD